MAHCGWPRRRVCTGFGAEIEFDRWKARRLQNLKVWLFVVGLAGSPGVRLFESREYLCGFGVLKEREQPQ